MCVTIRNSMHGVLSLPSLKKQRELIQEPVTIFRQTMRHARDFLRHRAESPGRFRARFGSETASVSVGVEHCPNCYLIVEMPLIMAGIRNRTPDGETLHSGARSRRLPSRGKIETCLTSCVMYLFYLVDFSSTLK